jgi:hypothetical protein
MGRQINFYMSNQEEEDFLKYIKSIEGMSCYFYKFDDINELGPINELPNKEIAFWYALNIWNKEFLETPRLKYIKEQNHYILSQTSQSVIEWSRSGEYKGKLCRGRLWMSKERYIREKGITEIKPGAEAMDKYFNILKRWIIKQCKNGGRKEPYYTLPEAAKLIDSGMKIR